MYCLRKDFWEFEKEEQQIRQNMYSPAWAAGLMFSV
jgi:hypothetical protein